MRALSIGFLAALLPFSLQAQGSASTATNSSATDEATAKSAQISSNTSKGTPESIASTGDADTQGAPSQQSKSTSQAPRPSKPKPSSDSDRPPIEGSMVGYIDNAIVGSEVRIRFD